MEPRRAREGLLDVTDAERTGPAGLGSRTVAKVGEYVRVAIVAGVPVGVVVAGLGSRLAMFVVRVTSPPAVVGMVSDDGFVIGRVTLGGTYALLALGAVVGVIGAVAYRLVAPWLIGPSWWRRATVAIASAVVVGSMLIHADGVDFTVLQPVELSVALFILLPGLFGLAIGPAVDSVAGPRSWTGRGAVRWAAPVLLVAAFPVAAIPAGLVALATFLWQPIGESEPMATLRATAGYGMAVRAVWLAIAVAGLVALIGDLNEVL